MLSSKSGEALEKLAASGSKLLQYIRVAGTKAAVRIHGITGALAYHSL
jgi:hypothetical protein